MTAVRGDARPVEPGSNDDTRAWVNDTLNDLGELRHLSHFLAIDVERGFELSRGKRDGNTITFRFQVDGVDATNWLTGDIWRRINCLWKKLDKLDTELSWVPKHTKGDALDAIDLLSAGIDKLRTSWTTLNACGSDDAMISAAANVLNEGLADVERAKGALAA